MMVLGGWVVGNIVFGVILVSQWIGESCYFYGMNVGWNLVNLGLAIVGYIVVIKGDFFVLSLAESINEQYSVQKIFLFNVGLDVGYMLGGVYLIECVKNIEEKLECLWGFGKFIFFQGGFLFVFDLAVYFWQVSGNDDLQFLL